MQLVQHWSHEYIGRPYVHGEYDCMHLVREIRREVFDHDLDIPTERGDNVIALSGQIDDHLETHVEPIDEQEAWEGDLVLMKAKGRLNHTGILCRINGINWVLHNLRNVGSVGMHRIKDLHKINLELEGIYRWKSHA